MMFHASVSEIEGGEFLAECDEPHAIARGLSARCALDNLRAEIRYRIELCPCTGVDDDYVELDVTGGQL